MKNLKPSVFALFTAIDVEKFPDNCFEKDEDSTSIDLKYDWLDNGKKKEFYLFDKIEKHVNKDNIIQRIILTCSSIVLIKIDDLALLVNKLCQIENSDEDCSKCFSDADKIDFLDKKNWQRSWFTLEKNKIHVHIYRKSDLFAMHIVFLP